MPRHALQMLTETMFYVLMALENNPMCGIDISSYIEQKTKGRVKLGPATLYTILGKFEKEKYIKEIEVDGRKRTYQITPKGETAYHEELNRLQQCVADAMSERGIFHE